MELDLVHDIQKAYRKIVDSMSRPGLISNIKDQAGKVDMEIGCFKSTMVLILMLFDTEVTFKLISERKDEITKRINQLTYAKATEAHSADFILVLQDARPWDVERAFRAAHPGDLMDPHKSATMIIEAGNLSNDQDLTLTGPGIDQESHVKIQTTDHWVALRAEKNAEYSLGIDLIFTDLNHNILCIPRTTQIAKRVVG